MTKSNSKQIYTCPFLGLSDDTTSHMAFTSSENFCHQCKPIVPIKFEHQNDYCLDTNFVTCPVYVNGAGKRMPADLIYDGEDDHPSAPADRRLIWSSIILVIFFIAVALFYFMDSIDRKGTINPAGINAVPSLTTILSSPSISPTETLNATLLPTASPDLITTLPVFTATLSPFPTLTPTVPTSTSAQVIRSTATATISTPPTSTPSSTQASPYSLDTPIGKGQLYLIHKVANGESLTTITENFQTSLEAILAVNSTLVVPIRIDAIVVIPLMNKNPQGLPNLEPYQVTQNQITPEALAAQLKTDLALLLSVNDLKDGEKLNKGNWILIPR
jgi:hypothetical protein